MTGYAGSQKDTVYTKGDEMTVKELIEVSPFCDLVEIAVRDQGHGKWVQGYRVGINAKLYPVNLSIKLREKYNLKSYQSRTVDLEEGQEIDCTQGLNLPMKVICKKVTQIPDYIGNLKICDIQPRHIPQIHKDAYTHNDFAYELDCFPDGFVPESENEKEKAIKENKEMDGQLTIDEWIINSVTY